MVQPPIIFPYRGSILQGPDGKSFLDLMRDSRNDQTLEIEDLYSEIENGVVGGTYRNVSSGFIWPLWDDASGLTYDPITNTYTLVDGEFVYQEWTLSEMGLTLSDFEDSKVYCLLPDAEGTFTSLFVRNFSTNGNVNTDMVAVDGGYLIDAVLDAGSSAVRLAITSTSGVSFSPPIFSTRPIERSRIDEPLSIPANVSQVEADKLPNLFLGFDSVASGDGNAMINGDKASLSTNEFNIVTLPIEGVESGDSLTIMFTLTPRPTKVSRLSAFISTGGAGGNGPEVDIIELSQGLYSVTHPFVTGNASDPSLLNIRVNSPTEAISMANVKVIKSDNLPLHWHTPGFVNDAFVKLGLGQIYVDPVSGDDVENDGTQTMPFATLSKALSVGSDVLIRSNAVLRDAANIIFSGRSLKLGVWRNDPTDAQQARVRFSTLHSYADFSNTAVDTNVIYKPLADGITAAFEVDLVTDNVVEWDNGDGVLRSRLGVANPARNGQTVVAESEADVRLNPGSWWHGAGSEGTGLYIRPIGDTSAGKGVDVVFTTDAAYGITFLDVSSAITDDISWEMGREAPVRVNGGSLSTTTCRYAYSGFRNGLFHETNSLSNIISNNCDYMFNQEDGSNFNGNAKVRHNHDTFSYNGGDGSSPHQANNDIEWRDCIATHNAKQGIVSVGHGRFVFKNNYASSNGDVDLYVANDGSDQTSVVAIGNIAPEMYFVCNSDANINNWTIDAHDNSGQLTAGASKVTITDHEALRGGVTGSGILVLRGEGVVDGFKISHCNTGLKIENDATLTAKNGHVLRCNNDIQEAGTNAIQFDSAAPVNFFGNNVTNLDASQVVDSLSFQMI